MRLRGYIHSVGNLRKYYVVGKTRRRKTYDKRTKYPILQQQGRTYRRQRRQNAGACENRRSSPIRSERFHRSRRQAFLFAQRYGRKENIQSVFK